MSEQTPDPNQIRDAWEAVAGGFDEHVTPHTLQIGQQIVSLLDLPPGLRVLDVGAGSGAFSIPAARAGAEVLALDISPTMVERLAARADAEALTTLRAEVGDGMSLDFGDASFDVTASLNGVSLFPDLTGGLNEMVRVTRAGGQVVLGTFGPMRKVEFIDYFFAALRAVVPELLPPPDQPLPPFRLAEPETFRRVLQGAGLQGATVDVLRWEIRFESVEHLLAVVNASNPIAGQMVAQLTEQQWGQVKQSLKDMLGERSEGGPGAVLHSQVNLGRGTV